MTLRVTGTLEARPFGDSIELFLPGSTVPFYAFLHRIVRQRGGRPFAEAIVGDAVSLAGTLDVECQNRFAADPRKPGFEPGPVQERRLSVDGRDLTGILRPGTKVDLRVRFDYGAT